MRYVTALLSRGAGELGTGKLANCSNSLRDSNAGRNTDSLARDVKTDLAFPDRKHRLVALDEAVLAHEKDDLLQHAVRFDGTPLDIMST